MKCGILAILIGFVMFTGCKKEDVMDPACKIAVKTLYGAAQGVAEVLECSDPAAIAADLSAPIFKLNLCSANVAQGMIGELVCPKVVSTVLSIGVGALPAAWGCKGGATVAKAETALSDGCKKLIKY